MTYKLDPKSTFLEAKNIGWSVSAIRNISHLTLLKILFIQYNPRWKVLGEISGHLHRGAREG